MLRLSDIARRAFSWGGRHPPQPRFTPVRACPVARTAEGSQALVPVVRSRLDIDERQASDAEIIACLRAIQARPDRQGRWLAAFNSRIGQVIAGRGPHAANDLHALIALAVKGSS